MEDQSPCVSSFFQENTLPSTEIVPRRSVGSPERSSQNLSQHSLNSTSSENDELSLSQLMIEEPEPLKIEPFFNITPREMPLSPHYIIEEEFKQNPWALLIATIFLTKTSGKVARRYMKEFFEEFSTPYHVLEVNPACLERYFEFLGLRKRAITIWKLSYQFISARWRRASDLYGVGKYGEDAYRIFCLGHTVFDPGDRYLKLYIDWLGKHTEFLRETSEAECEFMIEDSVLEYYKVNLRDLR